MFWRILDPIDFNDMKTKQQWDILQIILFRVQQKNKGQMGLDHDVE